MLGFVKVDSRTMKSVTVSVSCTWRPPFSAAPGAAGTPSLPSPPRTHASSPPAPCAEPPGSSSFAHDAAEATQRQTGQRRTSLLCILKHCPACSQKKKTEHRPQNT